MTDKPTSTPVTVQAQSVGLISLDTGGAVLLASFSFLLGAVAGGIVLPFVMSDGPDMGRQQEELDRSTELGQLRASLAPLGIWASPSLGGEPVATGLSLGQLLEELDFRGQRAGLSSAVSVTRDGGVVSVELGFTPIPDTAGAVRVGKGATTSHPRLIRLVLAAGTVPGTLVLTETLADDRPLPVGASFVDLVTMGGIAPPLPDGHVLTRLGVVEIRALEDGTQAAFLDNRRFYPALPASGEPLEPIAAGVEQPETGAAAPFRPVRLMVASQDPATGPFRERLVLVAAPGGVAPCSARAVIFDSTRNSVKELPEPLLGGTVDVETGRDRLTLRGFCPPKPASAAPGALTVPAPSARIALEAVYTPSTGLVRWNRVALPDPGQAAAEPGALPVTGAWRSGEGRLASPIQTGGGLVSLSCQPGGGLSVAAAGLPPPPQSDQGLTVVFRTAAGTAPARMRWIAGSSTYELSSSGRPREAAAVLAVLRSGGSLNLSGGGRSHSIPAPGAAAVDAMRTRCGPAPAPASQEPAAPPRKADDPAPVTPSALPKPPPPPSPPQPPKSEAPAAPE